MVRPRDDDSHTHAEKETPLRFCGGLLPNSWRGFDGDPAPSLRRVVSQLRVVGLRCLTATGGEGNGRTLAWSQSGGAGKNGGGHQRLLTGGTPGLLALGSQHIMRCCSISLKSSARFRCPAEGTNSWTLWSFNFHFGGLVLL